MAILVGREAERAALEAQFREACGIGGSRMVLLVGPGGIGKTTLLDDFVSRHQDVPLLRGRAEALETGIPYGAFRHAVSGLLRQPLSSRLRTLVAGLVELDEPADRETDYAVRLIRLLRELSAESKPIVVVLDDLHEADFDTTSLIARLLRVPAGVPVFFLVAARPAAGRLAEPLGGIVERMVLDGYCEQIELRPFTAAGLTSLGTAVLGAEPTTLLTDYVERATHGVPFYAARLYRALQEQGNIVIGERADLTPRSMAAMVAEATVIAGHLPQMSPSQEQVARGLAILGRCRSGALRNLQRVIGLGEAETRLGILELVDLGLVVQAQDGWEFAHPILRATVYNQMPASHSAVLHDRAAAVLTEFAASIEIDPFAYANHVWRGVAASQEERRTAALRAANASFMSAPLVAAHWLGQAIGTLPPGDDLRVELLTRRSQACLLGTATKEAIDYGLQAIKEAGPGVARDEMMFLTVWAIFFANGSVPGLTDLVTTGLAEHPEDRGTVGTAHALFWQTYQAKAAADSYREAWSAAYEHNDSAVVTVAGLGTLLLYADQRELIEDRDRLREDVMEFLPTLPPAFAAQVLDGLGTQILGAAGALHHAVGLLEYADRLRGEHHAMSAWGFSEIAVANVSYLTGDWQRALELIDNSIWADELGGNIVAAQSLRALGTLICHHRGEVDKAAGLGSAILPDLPALIRVQADLARSLLMDPEPARKLLGETIDLHRRCGLLNGIGGLAAELYRRSAASEADRRQAAELVAELLEQTSHPLNRMWLLHALGDHRRDRKLLAEARDIARFEGLPFEHARVLLTMGQIFGDTDAIGEAVGIFEQLGARPWLDRAAAAGRRKGLTLRVPLREVAELTDTELSVVRLVIAGHTNREIAAQLSYSVKRVESLLTSIFRKLGVRRRPELLRLCNEQPELVFGRRGSRR